MTKNLDKDWLTKGWIDFEYKKYMLLAYLQDVKENFESVRLYPYLSDLVFHYQNLMTLKHSKQLLFENFPKEISKADFEHLKICYHQIVKDDALMDELEAIILFAIPHLQKYLDEGKHIYDFVEENLEIAPIGISPLRFDEGYFLISAKTIQELWVYEYQISIFERADEKYRGLNVVFLEKIEKNLTTTTKTSKSI